MNTEEIVHAREVAAKATPLPWEYRYGFLSSADDRDIAQTWNIEEIDFENAENNGEYIALACNNYPAALDEIERLREVLEEIRDATGWSYETFAIVARAALKGGEG